MQQGNGHTQRRRVLTPESPHSTKANQSQQRRAHMSGGGGDILNTRQATHEHAGSHMEVWQAVTGQSKAD